MYWKIPNSANARLKEKTFPVAFGRGSGTSTPSIPVISSVSIAPSSGVIGDTFSAAFTISGSPFPTLAYQWNLDATPIGGATSSAYVSDTAGDLTLTITATNASGTDGPDTSAAATVSTVPIAPSVTSASISPSSGNEEDTFTASATITGAPTPTPSYQWFMDGTPVGVNSSTHTANSGGSLTVTVTGTNVAGTDSDTAAAVTVTALAAPTNDVLPTVSGTAKVGSTLTRTLGTYSGTPTPSVAGNWQRDGVDIAGQTASTYLIAEADYLTTIRWQDTATNSQGSATANSVGQAITYAAPVASNGTWNVTEGVGTATYEAADRFTVAGDLDLSSMTGFTFALLPGEATFADGVFESGVFESGGGSGYLTINETTGQVTLDETLSGLLDAVDFTVRGTNPAGSADATITLTVAEQAANGDRFPYDLPLTLGSHFPHTLPMTFNTNSVVTVTPVVGGIQFDSDSLMTITAVEGGFEVETA